MDSARELLRAAVTAHRSGAFAVAQTLYEQTLRLEPLNFSALRNLGIAHCQQGRHESGIACFHAALARHEQSAETYADLSLALQSLGRYAEALSSCDRALALHPGMVDVAIRRGTLLDSLTRYEEAVAAYDGVLALAPANADAHNNRGLALVELGRYEEAFAAYEHALSIAPHDARTLNNRGNLLARARRFAEALRSFDAALAIAPDAIEPLHNSAHLLQQLGSADEALARYQYLLCLDAEHPYAAGAMFHINAGRCEWNAYEDCARAIVDAVKGGVPASDPFIFLTLAESPALQRSCAEQWVARRHPPMAAAPEARPKRAHSRIHIAYVSADLHQHATAQLSAGLFERHDRARFEISALSFGPSPESDPMRARLRRCFDRFIDVAGSSDRDIARRMAGLGVDIAVDLKGFTADSRPGIFAWRAAPLQVSYLGYPGTTGAGYIDYLIADRVVIPEADRAFYREQVVYLPESYQVNDDTRPIAGATPGREEAGLPPHAFVFCCFNSSYKITPTVFAVWVRLLRSVEGSVLWLLGSGATVESNLRARARQSGVDPARLVFAPWQPPDAHLARHALADLFLDTLPVNAHTTAADALYGGLPIVTCVGHAFAGRVCASLLNAAGLPELITHSLEEYEALALRLARDTARLQALRERLRAGRTSCALFDTDRFRRHIECAYETMWARATAGLPPGGFSVPALA